MFLPQSCLASGADSVEVETAPRSAGCHQTSSVGPPQNAQSWSGPAPPAKVQSGSWCDHTAQHRSHKTVISDIHTEVFVSHLDVFSGLLQLGWRLGLNRSLRLLDEQSRNFLQTQRDRRLRKACSLSVCLSEGVTDLLQLHQQSLQLIHDCEDAQSVFSLQRETKARFAFLDLSNCSPHGLNPLLNHLFRTTTRAKQPFMDNRHWILWYAPTWLALGLPKTITSSAFQWNAACAHHSWACLCRMEDLHLHGFTFSRLSLGLGNVSGEVSNILMSATSFSICLTSLSMASASCKDVKSRTPWNVTSKQERDEGVQEGRLTAAACSSWCSGALKLSCTADTWRLASSSCSCRTVVS